MTSRIWSIALKPKLCLSVTRNILAAIFNQAKVAVWVAIMPFLREADIKHVVQIGSLLNWRQLPLCNVTSVGFDWLQALSQAPCPAAYFKSFTSSVRSVCFSKTEFLVTFRCAFSVFRLLFLVFKDASRTPHSRAQMNPTEDFPARTHGIDELCHFPIVVDGNTGNMRSR